jgi:N utilization substance protein A
LSPARVSSVTIVDAEAKAARVVVPDYQLSLAIGKEGQNARLAARLTGWRIDIRPDTAPEEDDTGHDTGHHTGHDAGPATGPPADLPAAAGTVSLPEQAEMSQAGSPAGPPTG